MAREVRMELKKSIVRSLGLAVAASIAIYVLALGFFTTHGEVNVPTTAALPMAAWSFPVVFVLCLVFFMIKSAGVRKP